MGKSSAPPQAPDPYQSAQAQYQFGTQAAAYNKALGAGTTITPGATQTNKATGYDPATGAPIYTNTTTLSPAQQKIYDSLQASQGAQGQTAQQLAAAAGSSLTQPLPTAPNETAVQMGIDTSGVPGIIGANDLNAFTQQQQQAAYANQTQYLDPQYSQQQEQLDAQLRNSGAHPGDPAYDNAMKLFTNQKQQAYESAFNNSQQTGLAAQQALYGESANTNQQAFGEAAAKQQAANAASQQKYGMDLQQLGAKLGLRLTPEDEYSKVIAGISSPGGAPSMGMGGGSGGGGGVSAPDIMSAFNTQYQGQLAGYNANVATQNANTGAAASLAAMAIMAY